MDWGLLQGGVQDRGRILAPRIPIDRVSFSPLAGVLGNKLVTLGIRYCLRLFTLSTCSFVSELSVTDSLKAFLGNGSVNTFQRATMETVSQWTNVTARC
jgi:hypothetical protein